MHPTPEETRLYALFEDIADALPEFLVKVSLRIKDTDFDTAGLENYELSVTREGFSDGIALWRGEFVSGGRRLIFRKETYVP